MLIPKRSYAGLKDSYLFYNIAQKVNAYAKENPGCKLYRLGVGDVTQPLSPSVIAALREGVEDQSKAETFHGYMPECGAPFLRAEIAKFYRARGVDIADDEVFCSGGASDELGDLLDLFETQNRALVIEPAYPAYVDANIMAGREIVHLEAGEYNDFLPLPDENKVAEIIYICSPSNPTGAVYDREKLKKWVDFANEHGSVILFDAAYEAFIEEKDVPHSIFEIDGAKTCAIEICSLSKTAGFTGTRFGYTVIPKALIREGMSFNDMWVRNRTTKTNGISYIIQKGASAVFTPQGREEVVRLIAVYKKNAQTLMKVFEEAGIKYFGGKNAPYIWIKCPYGMTGWEFFDYLLHKVQVVGTPGEGFGKCGEGYFRFSTFASPSDTEAAAKKLSELFCERQK